MELKNKKILITGGAGFIGSHLADALIRNKARVVIIDNLVTGRRENINPQATFYENNIADYEKIKEIFQKEKPEFVYHFAFNVLVPESTKNPLIDIDSIVGSVNILKNSQESGVKKIIFASSSFVYGNNPNLPIKETEPIDPVSSYVVAKDTIENYLRFFNNVYNLPYVIFRYSTTYGSRQVKGAMADYIRQLNNNKQAKIWGDGNKTRDYIFIDDVVQANLLALDLPSDFSDPVFNVSTGKETALNDLYEKIAQLLNKKAAPIYLPERPGEMIRNCLSNEKIKKVMGWQPKNSLEEGLRSKLKSENLI
jgi:UDP-glucose 4-epimerase